MDPDMAKVFATKSGMERLQIATRVIAALALGFVVALDAEAQQATRIPRIGYLATYLVGRPAASLEAFLEGLHGLGYVEGKNVVIEYRDAEGKGERLPALAAELVALKVDVIVAAAGTPPALAARGATRTVPIVFIAVGNPVSSGLVISLARPGGNATGLSAVSPELTSKWLELITQAVPGIARVAFLRQPGALGGADEEVLKQAEGAARTLGVRLQLVEARGPADLDRAFSEMTKAHAGALAVLSTPMFSSVRGRIIDLASQHRLPTVFSFRQYVDAGGFMSYGPNQGDLFRRAATYVDRILKGARPADLPVEQPTTFELVINLKTAKALGLTIPPSLLLRADEVIQ
jgi:putative ABC transport system substrate-binding protein